MKIKPWKIKEIIKFENSKDTCEECDEMYEYKIIFDNWWQLFVCKSCFNNLCEEDKEGE